MVLLHYVSVSQVLKVVSSDSLVGVRSKDGPAVTQTPQALHPHSLPRVQQVSIQVTLVELPSLATGDKAFAIWIPGHTGQAILMRLTHLCS